MKRTILFAGITLMCAISFAQKKTTTSATISFDAATPIDALPKAENKTVVASINTKNGKVAFEAIVKSFNFSNPKMQEHFNGATWMDSDKFPTATFKGRITNLKAVNFAKDGSYNAEVEGDLTIHGETKKVKVPVQITVKGGTIVTNTTFSIKLEDHKINGPAIGAGKVAKEPSINVTAEFRS